MRRRSEDSSVWIGYADFLTTLTVLFFVIAITFAGKHRTGDGYVRGKVTDEASNAPIADCAIIVGDTALGQSSSDGTFEVKLTPIQGMVKVGIAAGCAGYDTVARVRSIAPGRPLALPIKVSRSRSMNLQPLTLSGDALFAIDSYVLKPEAIALIVELGSRMKAQGGQGVIAVQGHTDDVPFASGSGNDNWVLSAQRAAAAARILEKNVGIRECNILIMGFGPSRPVEPVRPSDALDVKRKKRKNNRRIEFRRLTGSELQGRCGS